MKLPKQIVVFGQAFEIIETTNIRNDDGSLCDGLFYPSTGCIAIDKTLDRKEKLRTLIHELGHALWQRMSLDMTDINPDLEEIIVNSFALMMTEIFDIRLKRKTCEKSSK